MSMLFLKVIPFSGILYGIYNKIDETILRFLLVFIFSLLYRVVSSALYEGKGDPWFSSEWWSIAYALATTHLN